MTNNDIKPMKLSPIQRFTRASPKPVRRARLISLFFAAALAHSGCQHIGPPTIAGDRLAYNKAIASSWKNQILLNLVRLRYCDIADFVDVGTASQNYTLTGTAEASFGASIYPLDKMMNTLTPTLTASRTKMDNPTVTYTPQSGSDFIRNLNTPIKAFEIFNLIEGGYRADYVLDLTVKSIDDTDNSPENRNFEKLVQDIADAWFFQNDVSFPSESPDKGEKKVFMIIPDEDSKLCQECRSTYPVAAIRKVLRLKAGVTKFEIVPGRHAKETEIAVQTRSVISVMNSLSQYVPSTESCPPILLRQPSSHRARFPPLSAGDAKQQAISRTPIKRESKGGQPPLKVFMDTKKPSDSDAFAAIQYQVQHQDYWFWVPKEDFKSKQSFIFLRTFLALADTGARPTAPVLAIPASR